MVFDWKRLKNAEEQRENTGKTTRKREAVIIAESAPSPPATGNDEVFVTPAKAGVQLVEFPRFRRSPE